MDESGVRVVEYIYDAWGKLISTTGTLATTLGADNPFRYRGYYYDTETGLYYLTTRYYDPEVCRFIIKPHILHNLHYYRTILRIIFLLSDGRIIPDK